MILTETQKEVIRVIEEQLEGHKDTGVEDVAEDLSELCKENEMVAEFVLQDLNNEDMSIVKCEKKIQEYADIIQKEKKLNSVSVSHKKAKEIIKEFYGITNVEDTEQAKPVSLMDLI